MIELFTEFRFIIVSEGYNVFGTNNEDHAKQLAKTEMVFDLTNGQQIDNMHNKILEVKPADFGL